MGGRIRTFTIGADTYDIPEEEAYEAYRELSGGHELPEEASDPMHVGAPEVIKGKTSAESFDSPPPAADEDPAPAWLGALAKPSYLSGHSNLSPSTHAELQKVNDEYNTGISGLAAGGLHGTAMGLERNIPYVREWSMEAEHNSPKMFLAGDIASNLNPYAPANLAGKVTQGIKASSRLMTGAKGLADVATQVGIDAADSTLRRWSDSDNPEYSLGDAFSDQKAIESLATAAFAVPGAIAGAAGGRSHFNQTRPDAVAQRTLDYRDANYRAAGLNPTKVKQLPPEKQEAILAQIELIRAQSGPGLFDAPTMKDVNRRAHTAARMAHDEKTAAIEALAAMDAQISPDTIAANIRGGEHGLKRGSTPPIVEHNTAVDRVAQGYNDMERELQPLPPAPPVPPAVPPPIPQLPPTAAAQGLPPPPLPAGPPPVAAAPQAPRVSARAQPMPAAPPARPSARAPRHINPPIGEGYVPPQDMPSDPVGALAAQGAPPPPDDMALLMEQEMLPQLEATPGAMSPDELIEQDIAAQLEREAMGGPPPPRPGARYAPPADADGFLMGNEVAGSGRPAARYQPPPPTAAPAMPANVGNAGQPPAMPTLAAAPPAPPPMGPPTSGPMQGPLAQRGIGVEEFQNTTGLVGGQIDLLNKGAENRRLQHEYGALMEAARAELPNTRPMMPYAHPADLTQQWDSANRDEGILRIIADEGQAAADASSPRWISALGGIGSAGSIGAHALGSIGTPTAVGLGAGVAAGRWALPRAHALEANWLSRDTASMMERVSGFGRKPVGSIVSGFGDLMRTPPPPATESGDPDNGATSSLDPGSFLGRNTTQAMLTSPDVFMAYADDYSRAGTDDKRAAVTERLYRTDPDFASNVFPMIRGGSEIA